MMYFANLGDTQNPGTMELENFYDGVMAFLEDTIRNDHMYGFLWEDNSELRVLAQQTFNMDIREGEGLELANRIEKIEEAELIRHGLQGRPLQFKLAVLQSIDEALDEYQSVGPAEPTPTPASRRRKWFSVRPLFKKIVDVIDAILGSLIDAVGAGGLVKEFKDALRALV